MSKSLFFLAVTIFSFSSLTAQDLLALDKIQAIFDASINKKEFKILNHDFILASIQPIKGSKLYNKGLMKNYYKESISFVTRLTEYNDPVGVVSYQTWIPKHYAKLSKAVSSKYKHLGNFEFTDSKGLTYDTYQGENFIIMVYSFSSTNGKMVGNIVLRPI